MEYAYQANGHNGKQTNGFVNANNEAALTWVLEQQGLTLTEATVVPAAARSLRGVRVRTKSLIAFTYQLAGLYASGVPLLIAFDDLQRSVESNGFKKVLLEIENQLRGGASLGRAMRQFPRAFPDFYVSIVEAGEASGTLDTVLIRAAEYLEWREDVKAQLKTLTIYPIVLLLALAGLVVITLVWLIPRLLLLYNGAAKGVAFPLPTRIVMAISDVFVNQWQLVVAGTLVAVLGFYAFRTTDTGRYVIDYFWLKVPLLGPLVQKIFAARFTATLANMFSAGIDVTRAMDLVASAVGNRVLERAIQDAREDVQRGGSLADAIEATGVFQPLIVSMIRAGERIGKMDETLAVVNRFYDREIPTTVKRMIAIIEPGIIILAGGVVVFVVASALLPIYQLVTFIR